MDSQTSKPAGGTVEEIFHAALPLDAARRDAWLATACGGDARLRRRVEALLRASATSGGFLPEQPRRVPDGEFNATANIAERPGDRIGPYELLAQIGSGGFGVVFKAEQREPIRRLVALKIIKLGMDTREVIARFEGERQTLAVMDHPNIAKVLEAGATDTGRPYFVMELVDGISITEYCDQNRLSMRARLGLFTAVCRAVQHAHTKGIIHRDIKPSNVLVTVQDGGAVPKLIDFGIAKAMTPALRFHTAATALGVLGTPAYMSPEQAGLNQADIDTRSDVYSLGVLLYEMLTGQPPFEAEQMARLALDEVLQTIREKEPPRPSDRLAKLARPKLVDTAQHRETDPARLTQVLRGDLDCIVMKCLEKSPTRRYESASSLARDVQRHLENEPITASPPGLLYRFQKLVRRNKTAFSLGAALLLAALGGGLYWWFLPGLLNLEVDPADAQIEIDGRPRALGKMPLQLKLPAGEHQVSIRKPEFTDEFRTVVVPRGGFATVPHLGLRHFQGTLDVESATPGTGISFAGVDYFARIKDQPVDTGAYDMMAFADEMFDVHHAVTIRRGQRTVDRFSLEKGVLWKFPSSSLQGGFVIITNCAHGGPPVIVENMLEEILCLSSLDGSPLSHYKVSEGRFRSMRRLRLGPEVGSILVSAVEEPGAGPVLTAFSDSWPMQLLWEWRGPAGKTSEPGSVSITTVSDPSGSDRIAVAGRDGRVYLIDPLRKNPDQIVPVFDAPLDRAPELAVWKTSGRTRVLVLTRTTHGLANRLDDFVLRGVLVDAGSGQPVWQRNFGTNNAMLCVKVDRGDIPWIITANDQGWRTFSAESGEQRGGHAFSGPSGNNICLADAGQPAGMTLVCEPINPSLPMQVFRLSDSALLWTGPANLARLQPSGGVSHLARTREGAFLVALTNSLAALDAATGRLCWQVPATLAGFLADEETGNLYVMLQDQRLLCLDSTGRTNWTLRLHEKARPEAVIRIGGGGRSNIMLQGHGEIVFMVHAPRLLWELPTKGAILSAPLLVKNSQGTSLIAQFVSSQELPNLQGLDAASGRVLWSNPAYHLPPNRAPALADLDGDGVPVVVAIACRNETGKNHLLVQRASDGRLLRALPVALPDWMSCTPAMADFRGIGRGDVAVNTWDHPRIVMLDGRSGEILWQQNTEAANMSTLVSVDLDGDGLPDVIATSMDGHVYALRGKDGKLLWKSSGTNCPAWSPPVVADLDGDGRKQVLVTTLSGQLAVLDGKDGRLLWTAGEAVDAGVSGRAVIGSIDGRTTIIVPMGPAGAVAFDWTSRREIWRSPGGNPVLGAPVIADLAHDGGRQVVLGTTHGEVYVLRLADGKTLWHAAIAAGPIHADPVVADLNQDGIDDLLIASLDFHLYAIDGKNILSTWEKPGPTAPVNPLITTTTTAARHP